MILVAAVFGMILAWAAVFRVTIGLMRRGWRAGLFSQPEGMVVPQELPQVVSGPGAGRVCCCKDSCTWLSASATSAPRPRMRTFA
jgi:hypothetical protein